MRSTVRGILEKPCFGVIVFAECAQLQQLCREEHTHFFPRRYTLSPIDRVWRRVYMATGRLTMRPAWSLGRVVLQFCTPASLPPGKSMDAPIAILRENALTVIIAVLCVYDAVIIWLLLAG